MDEAEATELRRLRWRSRRGMRELEETFLKEVRSTQCFDFVISVGMAQGKPQVEIESVMEFARFGKKPIATFQCGLRR